MFIYVSICLKYWFIYLFICLFKHFWQLPIACLSSLLDLRLAGPSTETTTQATYNLMTCIFAQSCTCSDSGPSADLRGPEALRIYCMCQENLISGCWEESNWRAFEKLDSARTGRDLPDSSNIFLCFAGRRLQWSVELKSRTDEYFCSERHDAIQQQLLVQQ